MGGWIQSRRVGEQGREKRRQSVEKESVVGDLSS